MRHVPLLSRGIGHANANLAALDQVEAVAFRALAHEHLARGEDLLLRVRGEVVHLRRAQRGEQLRRREDARVLRAPLRRGVGLVRRRQRTQADVANGEREADPGPAEVVPDEILHAAGDRIEIPEIRDVELHRVLHGGIAVARQEDRGRRLGEDLGHGAQHALQRGPHEVRRRVVRSPHGERERVGRGRPRVVQDRLAGDGRVRDQDVVVGLGPEPRGPPGHVRHAARVTAHAHPVANLERPLGVQRQAGNQVAQRVLRRVADDVADHQRRHREHVEIHGREEDVDDQDGGPDDRQAAADIAQHDGHGPLRAAGNHDAEDDFIEHAEQRPEREEDHAGPRPALEHGVHDLQGRAHEQPHGQAKQRQVERHLDPLQQSDPPQRQLHEGQPRVQRRRLQTAQRQALPSHTHPSLSRTAGLPATSDLPAGAFRRPPSSGFVAPAVRSAGFRRTAGATSLLPWPSSESRPGHKTAGIITRPRRRCQQQPQ